MSLAAIQQDFKTLAAEYDDFIRRMIPGYEAQNEAVLKLIPYEKDAAFHALDLGAGTGALSRLILDAFPNAHVTLLDMTQDMLDKASGILAPHAERVETILGTFEDADFDGPYDLAVAGLTIHHVDDAAKEALFHKVSSVLNPRAWFIIRDYVKGPSPELNQLYDTTWEAHFNLREDEKALFYKHIQELDQPALLEDQLTWLRAAGFDMVDCYLKYFAFCVFGGQKRG